MYRFGPFEVDFSTSELRKSGAVIRIQEQPLRILEALLESPGELVTRERLRDRLWPSDTFVDFERSLNAGVAKLRQVLHDSAEEPVYIETVARKGYRFIAPVTRPAVADVEPSPPPPVARPDRRRWLAVGLILVVTGLTLLAMRMTNFQPKRSTARPVRFTVSLPADTRVSDGPYSPSMAISPDGQTLALILSRANGPPSIWLRRMDSEVAHHLDGTDGAGLPFWSPDSTEIGFFADNQLKRIAVSGGPVRVLCNSITAPGGASWGRAGMIVFSAANVLHSVDTSGGPCRQLTRLDSSESRHAWPAFLPDGRRFLYFAAAKDPTRNATFLASLDHGRRRSVMPNAARVSFTPPDKLLYVREDALFAQRWDLDALRPVQSPVPLASDRVVAATNVNPAWSGAAPFSVSENGVLAYRTSSQLQRQLVCYDRYGKLLRTIGPPGGYAQFTLSPDEKTVAIFVSLVPQVMAWRIWLMRLETEVITKYDFGHKVNGDPVWAPDSKRIVLSIFDEEDQKSDLYHWNIGEDRPHLLLSDGKQNKPDDWSADGRVLVYRQGNRVAGALDMNEGGKLIPTGDTDFRKDQMQLSPDGKLIAYNSDKSNQHEVYVATFPAFQQTIQVSAHGGVQPLWSSDGKELYYLAADKNLMSVQIRPGTPIESTAPKVLFQTSLVSAPWGSHYAVSRDGRRIYVLQTVSPPPDAVHVFTDWDAAK